jgi:hypothetical protein
MDKPNSELTTTLHLNSRPQADTSPSALIESLLTDGSTEEHAVFQEIMNGSGSSAMVVIHRGPSRGARFLITASGAKIGRAPANDIFLDDVTVSRSHAAIELLDGSFQFKDSGSLNGSYINNTQTSVHTLSTGDEIQIGKYHLLFIGATQKSGEK